MHEHYYVPLQLLTKRLIKNALLIYQEIKTNINKIPKKNNKILIPHKMLRIHKKKKTKHIIILIK